mgnify:CR=1 FL=1
MIQQAIVKIVNKEDLTYDEAYTVMNEIMSGETSPYPERRLPGRPVHQERPGRDHRRDRRLRRRHAGPRHPGGHGDGPHRDRGAREGTTPTASTSPPPPPW